MYLTHLFSQTKAVAERQRRGLHPVNEMGRFAILTICFFCSLCVSLTYAYDLFSKQLREQFGLSVGDLSTISTIGLVFCYFLLPYSVIYETCGPFLSFWICALTGGLGCLLLALTFAGKIPGSTASIAVFYAMLNTAAGLTDTIYIPVLFEYFPRNRGPVICLAKVMTGMGSSFLACMATTFFKGSITGFIYFLMAMLLVVMSFASATVSLPPYIFNWWRRRGKTPAQLARLAATEVFYEHKSVPLPRLVIGYTVVLLMVVFYAVQAPVVAYTKHVTRGGEIAIGVVAVVLLLSLCLVLLPLPCLGGMNEAAPPGAWEQIEAAAAAAEAGELEGGEGAITNSFSKEEGGDTVSKTSRTASNNNNNDNKKNNNNRDEDDAAYGPLDDALRTREPLDEGLDDNNNSNNNSGVEKPNGCAAAEAEVALGSSSNSNSAEEEEEGSVSGRRDDGVGALAAWQDPRYDAKSALHFFLCLDLWLVLAYSLCICPICILVSFNASTISVAKSGAPRSEQTAALYNAFLGVGNTVGRIAFGLFEAYVQQQDPRHRRVLLTHALPFPPLLVIIGGVVLIVIPASAVLFPFIVVYALNGCYAAMGALLYTSLFQRYHNMLYSLGFMITVISAVIFNRLLFGVWVDNTHRRLQLAPEAECNKTECIRVPFIVVTVLGVPGVLLGALIHWRYRRFVGRARAAAAAAEEQQLGVADVEEEMLAAEGAAAEESEAQPRA